MIDSRRKKKHQKKKNPGRPSSFKPEYTDLLIAYFSTPPYHQVVKKITEKQESGESRINEVPQFRDDGTPIYEISDFPTMAGFAIKIGVHRDTLQEWAKNFAEFSDAYKKAKDYQENFLAVNGNRGLLPPAFAIFTAKNVIQWRDKQPDEVDLVINNHALSDEQLDNRIESLLKKAKKKGA
jgi:hypothetical protein